MQYNGKDVYTTDTLTIITAAYVGKKANRPTSDILNMPLSDAWLFTRGQPPQRLKSSRRLRLTSFPLAGRSIFYSLPRMFADFQNSGQISKRVTLALPLGNQPPICALV